MEAKDTVSLVCICSGRDLDNKSILHSARCLSYNKGKKEQAEISFKAGQEQARQEALKEFMEYEKKAIPVIKEQFRQEGRKEVVDWIRYIHPRIVANPGIIALRVDELARKCEKWGLE